MGEEPARETDPKAGSVDRIVRRLSARRGLPPIRRAAMPALGPPSAIAEEGGVIREPAADIVLTQSRIYVTIELPGASKETLGVIATDRHLSVRAGGVGGPRYESEIELPAKIDSAAVTATYRNGVLDLSMPRRTGRALGSEEE